MPAVGADDDQLLPDVPDGYTACTKTVFDPRIDPTSAAQRSDAWQAEAAKLRPSLHPVDVRAAFGPPDDDHTPDDQRPERMARFTLAQGVVEMRFPRRLSRIRTARRAAQPEYGRCRAIDGASSSACAASETSLW
jgi:hypothetical protein